MSTRVVRCPFCGGDELRPLYTGMRDRIGLYPKEFTVLSCAGCGSSSLDSVPSAEELKDLYPAEYIIKEDQRRGLVMDLWSRAEMRLFYDLMYGRHVREFVRHTGLTGGRLLDVGCGNGRRMKEFAAAGFEVEGVETSQVDVDYANRTPGCRVRCGTLAGLDFEQGSYDAVTFFNVFEHLPDPAETAEKVFRMLRPGGVIYIFVPVMDSLQAGLFGRRWIEVAEMPRHIFIPSTRGMLALLRACGYSVPRSAPVSFVNLAHVMAESLVPHAVGSDAYRMGRFPALMNRALGASVMLLSMPFAMLEKWSGRASSRVFWAGRPGGARG